MSTRRLVIGLGNPGDDYTLTRHNIGFMVTETMAERAGLTWKFHSRSQADVATSPELVIAKPQTYMNKSGQSVRAVLDYFTLEPSAVTVVMDDVDLPFGELRVRPGGGAGGHHGLEDIIAHLGTDQIRRIRFGIGRGPGTTTDHVLGRFTPDEQAMLPTLIDQAAVAAEKDVDE